MSGQRINKLTAIALISAAMLFDTLQIVIDLFAFVPFVGLIMSILLGFIADLLAIFLFAIWFSHINVSLMTRYPLGFIGTIVLEQIPVINTAPGWTWFVITTIAKENMRANTSPDGV